MTEAVIAKLEEAFAWGCTDIEACLWADIATPTLYLYQEKHPEFIDRKNSLKEKPILLARKSVVDSLPKDSKLAMDFLSRKRKDEFSTKSETDLRVKELPQPILGGVSKSVPSDNGNS
jgi:hypothetical protein